MPVRLYYLAFLIYSTKETGTNYMFLQQTANNKVQRCNLKLFFLLSCLLCGDTTLVQPLS